jgi:hypothetical protein
MKAASVAFLAVLLLAHRTGDRGEALALPLSGLREREPRALGYLLFALLLLACGLLVAALVRARRPDHACFVGLSSFLLLVVALTPSENALHLLCALALLLGLYLFYASLLRRAASPWLWAHLTVPLLVLLATQFHSYGLWQKSYIFYFLLVANVHHHCLPRGGAPRRGPATGRRRVAHDVAPGQRWARKRPPRPWAS